MASLGHAITWKPDGVNPTIDTCGDNHTHQSTKIGFYTESETHGIKTEEMPETTRSPALVGNVKGRLVLWGACQTMSMG